MSEQPHLPLEVTKALEHIARAGSARRAAQEAAMRKKQEPLCSRILRHYQAGTKGYHALLRAVFPEDTHPRAFRYQRNGGPPGCAMAFGRALRKLGLRRSLDGSQVEEQ